MQGIKLRNAVEIEMYMERKKKNIPDKEIFLAILLLREICNIQKPKPFSFRYNSEKQKVLG